MKTSTVLVILVLVVLAAAAVFVGGDGGERPSSATQAGAPLAPALADRVNDVDHLVVRDVDGDVTLVRSDDGARWRVEELAGYEADFETVKGVIVGAARLAKVARKTGRQRHFDRLGVQDVEVARSARDLGTLDNAGTGPVELGFGAGDDVVSTVILGDRGAGSDERYARVVDADSAWLVEGSLDVPRDAAGWVDAQIADVAATRLQRVTIVHADGEIVETSRADEETTAWDVADVPDGLQLVYEGAGRQPANGVAALRFEGVRPGGVDDLPAEARATTTYTTFDGLTMTITTAPKSDAPAAGDAPRTGSIEAVVSASAADDAEPDVVAEAEAIRDATDGWVFTLPTWKGDAMRKRMADLTAPAPPAEDTATDEAPSDDSTSDTSAGPGDAPAAEESSSQPAGEPPTADPTDDGPDASAAEPDDGTTPTTDG